MPSVRFTIDDADPRVIYSLGWGRAGSPKEYNGTTSFTETAGATFALIFSGTSIAAFGTVDNRNAVNPPNTSYILDGTEVAQFLAPVPEGTAYHQVFYQSPPLPNAEHTLVGRCNNDGGRVFIDYLVVATPLPPLSALLIPPLEPTPPPASAVYSTQSLVPYASCDKQPPGPRVSIGVLVGLVISSISAGIIVAGLAVMFLRRRKIGSGMHQQIKPRRTSHNDLCDDSTKVTTGTDSQSDLGDRETSTLGPDTTQPTIEYPLDHWEGQHDPEPHIARKIHAYAPHRPPMFG